MILEWVHRILIYEANGWLLLLYGLWRIWPLWAGLGAAVFMLIMDRAVEARANQTAAGVTGTTWMQSVGSYQAVTWIVFGLWMIAAFVAAPPVPLIGTVMWWVGAIASWFSSFERVSLLWRAKTGLALYALAALGFSLYARYTATLTPDAWAAMLGGQAEARAALARGRAYANTLAIWGLWLIIPLGYFSLIIQRLLVHPLPLTQARAEANDWVRAIRTRGRE